MNNTLKQHARTLRLSGLLESLELRLQEAEANRLPYAQFLDAFLSASFRLLIVASFLRDIPWLAHT